MLAYEVIKRKRDGKKLTREEMAFLIKGIMSGDIPDYQLSAFLMAVYFQGMTSDETLAMTMEMLNTGVTLDLSSIPGRKVDKHSTGGVGDKLTLTVTPAVAAAGLPIPMLAGRGLGHTGGTIDKLEAIPGFRTSMSLDGFIAQVMEINLAIMGQTEEIAPVDDRLYALRDVTATVDSIPLIASSIMSKKLAEGIDGLVLDVKVGSGSFMKGLDKASELARAMVDIGKGMGKEVVALITDMDQPLGRAVGNSLEVKEAIDVLKGSGPEDVVELTLEMGAWMLKLGGKVGSVEEGKSMVKALIASGRGLEKFRELIRHQGGDPGVIDDPNILPMAKYGVEVPSKEEGFIASINAEEVGVASMLLGAGRSRTGGSIDPSVGVVLHKKVGDEVEKGEPLATVYYNDERRLKVMAERLTNVFSYSDSPVPRGNLVQGLVT
ncbi:MAG: thymidine phosphorylase [Deltaproteobacteria bacterium]|nr:thymidine phosphorylase [Deltaproteobacteria bacterium]